MKALFLGAHPDDVEVGAGGTIQTLVADGWEVNIATYPADSGRKEEAETAAEILGTTYTALGVTEHRMILTALDQGAWNLIVTPSATDSHPEHRALSEVGLALARKNNVSLWQMNHAIPGGVYNAPQLNYLAPFSVDQLDRKLEALEAHQSQYEKYGIWWLSAVSARDLYLGEMIQRDPPTYAEGFHIVIG